MLDRIGSGLAGLLPGTRERRTQTASFAAAWAAHNDEVVSARPARMWVALGDSTSQGIGAPTHDRGWVGQVLDLLRDDDPGWDVVNLSVTGARIRDVVADQLPRLGSLPAPDLVTCAVGANDLLRARRATVLADLADLLDALAPGTVVATLPRGVRERLARDVNAVVRAGAPDRGLRVADVWAHTGPPWAGKYAGDGFHPNEHGYREWTRAVAEALGLPA